MKFLSFFKNVVDGSAFRSSLTTAGAIVAGSIGGALISGKMGADATKSAAASNQAGVTAGIAERKRQFDITQQQQEPFRAAGLRGLNKYEQMAGQQNTGNLPPAFSFNASDFKKYQDPGYQFARSDQLRSLDRVMARKGELGGGTRYRGLMELSQNLASREFGAARGRAFQDYQSNVSREATQYQRGYVDPMNRYASLANVGQTATSNLATGRNAMAADVSNAYGDIGRTNAASKLGQYGVYMGAVQTGLQAYGMFGGGSSGGNPASYYNNASNPNVAGDAYAPAYGGQ